MIRLDEHPSERRTRELLRRFRDLNLGPCAIDLSAGTRVRVCGCLSLDHPVEGGVRYRLVQEDGREQVLGIGARDGCLELGLRPDRTLVSSVERSIQVELSGDRFGRLTAPSLGARVDLETCDPREIEHFLRRIVRKICEGT